MSKHCLLHRYYHRELIADHQTNQASMHIDVKTDTPEAINGRADIYLNKTGEHTKH